jgi:HEAT repeat protein
MFETNNTHNLQAAISKLRSLHDGDSGVVDTIACGAAAIPELKAILFSREPSGIYEIRRNAVEALAGLHAFDVLRDFLSAPRDITDPIERTGEDAIINAAARVLGKRPDSRDLPLLYSLMRVRPLAGVIETLGQFRQPAALPFFIDALGDDFLRRSAEDAILHLGTGAIRDLVLAALDRTPLGDRELPRSISRRRSVLQLLEALAVTRALLPPAFFRIVEDDDPWIALRATCLCLPHMTQTQASHAVAGLIRHLKSPDDLLAREIEDILVEQYPLVSAAVDEADAERHDTVPIWRTTDHTHLTLARVKARTANTLGGRVHG